MKAAQSARGPWGSKWKSQVANYQEPAWLCPPFARGCSSRAQNLVRRSWCPELWALSQADLSSVG